GSSASARARRPAASTPSSLLTRRRICRPAWPGVRAQATEQPAQLPGCRPAPDAEHSRSMAEASETTAARPRALPAPPARLVEAGAPVEGAWAGAIGNVGFEGLGAEYARGLFDRRLVEKRWQALFLATPQAMVSLAVVDAGYLSSGIFAVFDRGARRLLLDSSPVLPPLFARVEEEPNDGMRAVLTGPRIATRIERSGGRRPPTPRS